MSLTKDRAFCCYKNKAIINNLRVLGKHTGSNFLDSFKILYKELPSCTILVFQKKKKIPNITSASPCCCVSCSGLWISKL